jgi:hypothetical protein
MRGCHALRCRIEPYVDQAAPLRGAGSGAPRAGLWPWQGPPGAPAPSLGVGVAVAGAKASAPWRRRERPGSFESGKAKSHHRNKLPGNHLSNQIADHIAGIGAGPRKPGSQCAIVCAARTHGRLHRGSERLLLSCAAVNIQVPGVGVAASNRGLRSSVGRGVAVVGERGFRDDGGL